MDIRTQAYMQEMRRQQVYRAYVAGIGDDPTPPAPFRTFMAIRNDEYPDNKANLSVCYRENEWESIQFDQEIGSILSGTPMSVYISCDNLRHIWVDDFEPGGSLPISSYTHTFTLNENKVLSIQINGI